MATDLEYDLNLNSGSAQSALGKFNGVLAQLSQRMLGSGSGAAAAGSKLAGYAVTAGAVAVASGILATAIGVVTAAFLGLKTGLAAAAEYEKTAIAFETLTGSAEAAKQVMKDLSDLAVETPFQEREIQGAARAMLAAGVPATALRQELLAMGNVAAATGTDVERLAVIYGQVAGKGKLYAEELQQFVEAGAGELRNAVASTLGVTTGKLQDMLSAGEVGFSTLQTAIQNLAGSGGKWGEAMAKQSQTNLGLLSTLQDNVVKVLRLLTQPINDGPIKAVLTTAVEVATKASVVMEQAIAQGKVGEALKNAFILGAKLGINATIEFVNTIPSRIKGALTRIAQAIQAAFKGGLDEVKKLYASFDGASLKFDTASEEAFFKGLAETNGQIEKQIRLQQSLAQGANATAVANNAWAKSLDNVESPKEKAGRGSASSDDRKKQAESVSLARDSIMGEIAQLKALAAGRKSAADEIAREMRIRTDIARIIKETGASEEQARKLAEAKAKAEDRIAGKRSRIRGVKEEKPLTAEGGSGRLYNSVPLSGGGLDGFYRAQQRVESDYDKPPRPGYRRGGLVPAFDAFTGGPYRNRFDVGSRVATATGAPEAAARGQARTAATVASTAAQTAQQSSEQILAKIHAELIRIRTA